MSDALDRLFNFTREADKQEEEKKVEPSSTFSRSTLIAPANGDVLAELPIHLLVDFPSDKHPFRPYTQEERNALKEDIIHNGVLQPAIVRPHPTQPHHYQIIAGHNRRTAAADAGYNVLPCIIRNLSDDDAQLQLISSNLKQRLELLPSEKAFAYKLQLDTMKRQGYRTDLTSTQPVSRLRSNELLGESVGESRETVRRYIRLTHLLPSLLKKVDERKLGLTVGETLSYLSTESQQLVEGFFFVQHSRPISQIIADRLRDLEAAGDMNTERLETEFCSPLVARQMKSVNIKMKKWRKYFDDTATQSEVIQTIEKALDAYFNTGGGKNS